MNKHWTWQAPIGWPVERHIRIDGSGIAMSAAEAARLGGQLYNAAPGDRVTDFAVKLQGTGVPQTCEIYVAKEGPSGRTHIARLDVENPSASMEVYEFALPAPCAVLEGESISVVVCLPLAGTRIGGVGHAKLDASEGVAA